VYSKNGNPNGPYLCRSSGLWTFSKKVCVTDADNLIARTPVNRHDILQCVGTHWNKGPAWHIFSGDVNNYVPDGDVSITSCDAGAFEFQDGNNPNFYGETLYMTKSNEFENDRLWNHERVDFGIWEEYSNDKPVYYFNNYINEDEKDHYNDTYFIHYHIDNDALGRWTISRNDYFFEYSHEFGIAWCFKENLLECTEGEWTAESIKNVYIEVKADNETLSQLNVDRKTYTDSKMAIYAYSTNDNKDEGISVTVIVAVVLLVVVLVIFFVGIGIFVKKRSQKRGKATFKADEILDDEEDEEEAEEIEVEVNAQTTL